MDLSSVFFGLLMGMGLCSLLVSALDGLKNFIANQVAAEVEAQLAEIEQAETENALPSPQPAGFRCEDGAGG